METTSSERLLVCDVVTLTFNCFSKMLLDSPTLIPETGSLLESFQFQFGFFRVLVFELCKTVL